MTAPLAEASVTAVLDFANLDREFAARLDAATKKAANAVEKNLDGVTRAAQTTSKKVDAAFDKIDADGVTREMSGLRAATDQVADAADRNTAAQRRMSNATDAESPTRLGNAMGFLGGKLAAAAAGFSAIAATAAGFRAVISTGNDYTVTLNTMQAVTRGTADQMESVSLRAKELGNDIQLPGTSANDAAAAMTELAKGGFTVEQSMAAAKGTLQLAAAAQIDAAQAATIQSQALQAFGLDASNAARVADVLANTANASSAEMTDVADALQQSGTVAKQFGLTIEDTTTAIGLFANAGIQGSDAGTLLKSALLALTDQGNPAQGAIEDLGLAVYDAAGNFVGLESLFGQLQDASKRMTPEMYQAATATLFGSDAARLAGIAAEQGSEGFANMEIAIGRQGAAAEVAAAKTQGLPGALESVTNAGETLALELYDLIDGPMADYARRGAAFISDSTPTIIAVLETLGGALGTAVDLFNAIPGPVRLAVAALLALKLTGAGEYLGGVLTRGATTARTTMSSLATEIRTTQAFAAAAGRPIGVMSASMLTLGDRVGGVTGVMRGLRTAGSNLIGMLGGPWAIGIAAAGALLAAQQASAASARQAQQQLAEATVSGAKAQAAFTDAVALANGVLSDQAINAGADVVKSSLSEITTLGERGRSTFESFRHGIYNFTNGLAAGNDAMEQSYIHAGAMIDQNNALKDVMADLKIGIDDVGQIVAQGGAAYDDLIRRLRDSGDAGQDVADVLQRTRDELQRAQTAAKNSTPGFATLHQAIKTLADESASATDRIDAMRTALDVLAGKPVALTDALQTYNQQVRDTASVTSEAWDRTQGWGAALLTQEGTLSTVTANGDRLYTTLKDIRDATLTAAEAGADMAPIYAQNEEQFRNLAGATGLTVDQIRNLAIQAGLVPERIDMLAALQGADTVQQQLLVIQGMLDTNAEGVKIPLDALDQEALRKLQGVRELTVEVDESEGIVFVDAPNEEAMRKLREIINTQLPDKKFDIFANIKVTGAASISRVTGGAVGIDADVLGKAGGGALYGGTRGRDSIPLLGMPGEHMLTVADVNAMGGQAGVYAFRRALHMASGGAVGGTVSTSDRLTELQQAMWDMVRSQFPNAVLTSATRTADVGAGYDFHMAGKAIDIAGPDMGAINAALAQQYPNALELFYDPGVNIDEGRRIGPIGGHSDHIHFALDDISDVRMTGDQGAIMAQSAPLTPREQNAARIIAEGRARGYSDDEIVAILATALQESNLDENASGGGGKWKSIFQQDESYPGRDNAETNITGFYDRLDQKRASPGSGDIWEDIFWLQQRPGEPSAGAAVANGRSGYMSEIQSRQGEAQELFGKLGNTTPGGTSTTTTGGDDGQRVFVTNWPSGYSPSTGAPLDTTGPTVEGGPGAPGGTHLTGQAAADAWAAEQDFPKQARDWGTNAAKEILGQFTDPFGLQPLSDRAIDDLRTAAEALYASRNTQGANVTVNVNGAGNPDAVGAAVVDQIEERMAPVTTRYRNGG